MQAAIEARAVGLLTRTGNPAIRDISLSVASGEMVAVTGVGPGRAVLLDALSGRQRPTSGAVARVPCSAGYVPAGDALPPALPLSRALGYTAELYRVSDPAAEVDRVLGLAGLASRAAVPCGALGPGERKRAALAAQLLRDPAQLFLDEPTADLDPGQAAELMRLLRRLSGRGTAVVLTTGSPLDAARCDKVALLASGGHLAFFGTPAGARDYFGADSLEEIYQRLAGVGGPATEWSRHFYYFSRTKAARTPFPAPSASEPALLVPDAAGPHSAGRVTATPSWPDPDEARPGPDPVRAGPDSPGPAPLRQLPVLVRRNVEIARRSAVSRVVLGAAPAVVLLAFAVLIGTGAYGPGAGRPWTALGGFCLGLCYGLPLLRGGRGPLQAERFGGLSATGYVLAQLAVQLPALAVAGAVVLTVPAGFGRLTHGFGPAYLTLLLAAATALALALLLSTTFLPVPARPLARAMRLPALVLAGAVLTLLDRPAWGDWLGLTALAAVLTAATVAVITRGVPRGG